MSDDKYVIFVYRMYLIRLGGSPTRVMGIKTVHKTLPWGGLISALKLNN